MATRVGDVSIFSCFFLLVLFSVQPSEGSINNSLKTTLKELSLRWVASSFSSCTVGCGSGRKTRNVRCVRDMHWRGRTIQAKMPDSLCPPPQPATTHSCNTHPCTAVWAKGNWSECSVTCGIGTQTREVQCENTLWSGHRYRVSQSECGGVVPDISRKCHMVDCPFEGLTDKSGIRTEDYTLIQFRRAKKLKVTVGGVVKLLPGQTVLVRCPVKDIDRGLVYWSKGYRLVSSFGRVKFTKKGELKIRKADPKTDAGLYTCVLGDKQAKIEVQFLQKHDPITKSFKTWIRKSRKHLKHHLKRYNQRDNNITANDVLQRPHNIQPQQLKQQRDQSLNGSYYQLSYVASEWSSCSAICKVKGHRKRKVTCSQVTPKYVKLVPDAECTGAGLVKPVSLQECSSGADCAEWIPGPWTECRPNCGKRVGFKTRFLMCKWQSSGLPAWTACDRENRPVTNKPCKPRPCPRVCKNSSRFCSMARLLKMCRYPAFRRKCCKTCLQKHHLNSTV